MTYTIASIKCGPSRPIWPGIGKDEDEGRVIWISNERNDYSPALCYQMALQRCRTDVLIYIHNDVTVHETDWVLRLLKPMEYSGVVAVGMGGATGLGNRDLYRKPFNLANMARHGYMSNQTDAEVHGIRVTGENRVAVLDAFCMAVDVKWLRSHGGWHVLDLTHHCLDTWLACEAARCGVQTYMVGVSCTHHGGGVSVLPQYGKAPWLQRGTLEQDHILPHVWIWDEYRDVLPLMSESVDRVDSEPKFDGPALPTAMEALNMYNDALQQAVNKADREAREECGQEQEDD